MADDEFYNPYQFIPLGDQAAWAEHDHAIPKRGQFDKTGFAGSRLSHAAYDQEPGLWHGRILCKLTLETPIFIGAERGRRGGDKNDYMLVEPYTIGGEPAVPASSLRGLISSLAEAASGSALRVLDDRKPVSYRMPMERGLSAIGLVVQDPSDPAKLAIQPLTAPLLRRNNDGRVAFTDDHDRNTAWGKVFNGYINFKTHIGCYEDRSKQEHNPSAASYSAQKFANGLPIDQPFMGYPIYYYMKVWRGKSLEELWDEESSKRVRLRRKGSAVVSQEARDKGPGRLRWGSILSDSQYRRLPEDQKNHYTRGFLRVLGGEARQMATRKFHELFIPCPEGARLPPPLPLSEEVVERFYSLSKELEKQDREERDWREIRPYVPFSDIASGRSRDGSLKLMPGHTVYFNVGLDSEQRPTVTAISFSSIWRGLVPSEDGGMASTWDFFRQYGRNGSRGEILPFNSRRQTISPAEAMFGFVSADATPGGQRGAYAGRVRFSAARLAQAVPESERQALFCDDGTLEPRPEDPPGPSYVKLKILSSPKPPSPAMYFRPDGNGKPIPKHDLRVRHEPNGRKVYLHKDKLTDKPWLTASEKNKNQKNAVRPLNPKACERYGSFWFHVDFDNLSKVELDLLCFALRPTEKYRHKIGMGKAIGLGAVQIEPVALFLIDRTKRYRDLFGSRYRKIHPALDTTNDLRPERCYARELLALEGVALEPDIFRNRAEAHAGRMPADVHDAVRLTGEPEHLDEHCGVHVPLTLDQSDSSEDETYAWFSANAEHIRLQSGGSLGLRPISSGGALPKLPRNREPVRVPWPNLDANDQRRLARDKNEFDRFLCSARLVFVGDSSESQVVNILGVIRSVCASWRQCASTEMQNSANVTRCITRGETPVFVGDVSHPHLPDRSRDFCLFISSAGVRNKDIYPIARFIAFLEGA